jgi:aminoglycoside 6'-N-acetyltransferase I
MEIERLSISNLEQLVSLVLELWDDSVAKEENEYYKGKIGSEHEVCYLGKEQGNYIAFLHVSSRNDYVEGAADLPVAYVEAIYVKPDYQKQGIAEKLMLSGENWARQKGYRQLASDTDIANAAALHFHKKNGFAEVGRIVCFIKDL